MSELDDEPKSHPHHTWSPADDEIIKELVNYLNHKMVKEGQTHPKMKEVHELHVVNWELSNKKGHKKPDKRRDKICSLVKRKLRELGKKVDFPLNQ